MFFGSVQVEISKWIDGRAVNFYLEALLTRKSIQAQHQRRSLNPNRNGFYRFLLKTQHKFLAKRFVVPAKQDAPRNRQNSFDSPLGFRCFSSLLFKP
jgi:hypothetical protein